ncbi:MAG: 4-hydroxy-tetrahydrodipicolinate reductase [Ruminococcaceae bacterium]|nr:4-hydroxy-tetrahydrodipicolinate reductase [Oscillospiraceae bacterium]
MIKILLSGANGRMGRAITNLVAQTADAEILCGVDINTESANGFPVYADFASVPSRPDVVIDFSNPANFEKLMDYAESEKLPVVVATTGLSKEQKERLHEAAASIPVFFSANMSLGVNLICELAKKATRFLGENFDIEIVERHHNQKLDAPSGTALAIADAINEELSGGGRYVYDRHSVRKKRESNEIGIHAIRGGTIVGDHTVIFAGDNEIIELHHHASSREVFATGAVKAGLFMAGRKPGFYDMTDLINES